MHKDGTTPGTSSATKVGLFFGVCVSNDCPPPDLLTQGELREGAGPQAPTVSAPSRGKRDPSCWGSVGCRKGAASLRATDES